MELADYKFFEQYRSSNILGTGGEKQVEVLEEQSYQKKNAHNTKRQESPLSPRRSKKHLQDEEEFKTEKPPKPQKKNLRFEATDWNEEEMLQHGVKDKLDQKIGGMYKKEERKIKRAVVAQAQNSAQS